MIKIANLIWGIILCGICVSSYAGTIAACSTNTLQYKYALLGNPVAYPEWTVENLQGLKSAGFNGVQLNIAWLRRPNDEALNLNDVVTLPGDDEASRTRERRQELQRRNSLAKSLGLRTMFHFGSPFMWREPETGKFHRQDGRAFQENWYEVQDQRIVEYETALLKEFIKAFPDVDDILVYTYDQDAWQVSEFSSSTLSRGVPLHERLPEYLQKLHAVWTEGRSEKSNIMWWEPWELSAGQVYKCIPNLPNSGFGLMLHNNIAEVQVSMPVDVWFRNTARMAMERGIPVVGEGFFGSATEEIEPLSFPFPRLIDEQFLAMTRVPGVVGVKEYFGVIPHIGDLNLAMFSARIAKPDACTYDLLTSVTSIVAKQPLMAEWTEQLSQSMQVFPWDVSWYARLAGTADPDHGWQAAFVRGQQVETPSWESTRRAHFMMTEDKQPHPFFLEDVQLRLEMTVQHLDKALSAGQTLASEVSDEPYRTMIRKAQVDIQKFRRVARSYALHMRETNVARLLREDAEAGRPLPRHLVKEMRDLLTADVNNQDPGGRAHNMLKQFEADPKAFVLKWLKPTDIQTREKGVFTLTTR